ncbi:MAG: TetR/AcrR family transcriptional regulator [Pseudomonadota bacterium]|nr:TetR/AcrR family transcriptional regulator [Pseudomonadota bacterium]
MGRKVQTPDGRRLSRGDWVEGAIKFLSQHSVGSLRLDLLVRQMGVTKGSFYWHFASREALLDAVLESWQTRMTRDIEAWLSSGAGTPTDQLRRLLHIGISSRPDVPGGPLELSLRDWARRDARVNEIVASVDAERLRILKKLYLAAGLTDERADAQALLHMTYVVGGRMMLFDGNVSTLEKRLRIGESVLIPEAVPSIKLARRKRNRQ